MIRITRMYGNFQKMGTEPRSHVLEGGKIVLSWTAECDDADNAQKSYRISLNNAQGCLLDSGIVECSRQQAEVDASAFRAGEKIQWHLTVWDIYGNQCAAEEYFYIGSLEWTAPWIAAPETASEKAAYFRKEFHLERAVHSAVLYVCGIGYQKVTVNGKQVTEAFLDPAHTDYTQECQYVVLPDVHELLQPGANCIGVMVGRGWRDNDYFYELARDSSHAARFIGPAQMTAMLHLEFEDGSREVLLSDESWQAGEGMVVFNSLFDGEIWDANNAVPGWDKPGCTAFGGAKTVPAPGGKMVPMTIPPIYAYEVLRPISVTQVRPGLWMYDMGRNIAGVPSIRLPKGKAGQKLVLEVTEFLHPDRLPDRHTIRHAAAKDEYIYSGDDRDAEIWQPELTYHGFRYFTIEGAWIETERISAIAFCTDLSSDSFFTCGSALVNRIQKMIIDTERDNQHSILTDCPQRDERMGWMNDATVRFEETVSNFHADSMMKKVVRDIIQAQGECGGITCTAPFIWGSCPADPVCSSFLIAGWLNYLHYGDVSAINEGYEAFGRWEKCLIDHSDGYIVNYSYYGDWAAPDYACYVDTIGDGACSKVTPGILMSTGYSYYNCTLLARMADILGKAEEEAEWKALADKIRIAMLEKWFDAENGIFGTDSMACLAFALWLEILPEEICRKVADRLNDKLIESDYHFTTGNLCMRYLFEMLTKYGHVDTAWTLITREAYPSWGWMLQNEATTVWERFELKDVSGMNSHNHPMYGAVGYWFYAYIAGIRPLEPGFRKAQIQPFFPTGLQHANAQLDTVQGKLGVHWIRKNGKVHLNVQVPFGMTAEICLDGKTVTVGSGFHHLIGEGK